jgi:Immunoglobulin I-set domain
VIRFNSCACLVEPVQFTRPLRDVKVGRLGEPAIFECEVTKPDARAQWLKDGFDLHHGSKYDIGVAGRNYRLTIRDVDDRDAGDYAIVVSGHRSEARLNVEARPEFKVSDSDYDLCMRVVA